ncbi:MAG: hypothetical protein J2P15_15730 [Micromonosporaceae bacterium]|nr:hypothetical protein [Micromonosporaceae bacterium]
MSLGSDKQVCTTEFVEAMRRRLDAADPPMGSNVDNAEVRKNFEALGDAAFRILTVQAETVAADPAFFVWVSAIDAYVRAVGAWQQGVRQAFSTWAPADVPGQQLRAAILGVTVPGPPPGPAPGTLAGRLR